MMQAGAIEWGSVAEWVSGLGSLAAVLTALYVARGDRRRADGLRAARRRAEDGSHNLIIDNALKIVEPALRSMMSEDGRSWRGSGGHAAELLNELRGGDIHDPNLRLALFEAQALVDPERNTTYLGVADHQMPFALRSIAEIAADLDQVTQRLRELRRVETRAVDRQVAG